MMITVSELLDRVSAQIGAKNDHDLAKKLGLARGQVTFYRQGKREPDDDRLAQLYELAGLDPAEGLLRKRAALSKGPARKYYERLLQSVAAIILAVSISHPAKAGTPGEHLIKKSSNVYIMR